MKYLLIFSLLISAGCSRSFDSLPSGGFKGMPSQDIYDKYLESIYLDSMKAGWGSFYRLPNGDTLYIVSDSYF